MEQRLNPSVLTDTTNRTERRMGASDIISHVLTRQQLFLDVLATQTTGLGLGWETIRKDERGRTVKKPTYPHAPGAVFTGDQVCALAAFALADGIRPQASDHVQIEVVSFLADFNKENWGMPHTELEALEHCVVKIDDPLDTEIHYLDPTYAASDHKEAGQIKVIPEEALDTEYRIARTNDFPDIVGTNGKHEAILDELLATLKFSKESYMLIVASLL